MASMASMALHPMSFSVWIRYKSLPIHCQDTLERIERLILLFLTRSPRFLYKEYNLSILWKKHYHSPVYTIETMLAVFNLLFFLRRKKMVKMMRVFWKSLIESIMAVGAVSALLCG